MAKVKTTKIQETETEQVKPPEGLFAAADGVVQIYRVDPPDGYLDQWPAGEATIERIKSAFGGGVYDLAWFPPEGSSVSPRRERHRIAGRPTGREWAEAAGGGTSGGLGPVVGGLMRQVEELRRERTEAERQRVEGLSDEWGKVLEMQREVTGSSMASLVAIINSSNERVIEGMREAGRQSDRVHQSEMERIREHNRAMLEMMKERQTSALAHVDSSDPLSRVEGVLKLVEALKVLSPETSKTTTEVVANAIPAILNGVLGGIERVGDTIVKVRGSGSGRMDPDLIRAALPSWDGEPMAGAGDRGTAGGASVPTDPSAASPGPGGGAGQAAPDWGTVQRAALVSWLQLLDCLEPSEWFGLIQLQIEESSLPPILDAPIRSALSGDFDPLINLLTDVGAGAMLGPLAVEASKLGIKVPRTLLGSAGGAVDAVGSEAGQVDGTQAR
uniref:Uncharacterized protein n=1 Tax=viral metagenome TaxID=1070528 RepID=A0A6M3JN90_9ZZZZ